MENPIKIDDLGVPLVLETSICYHWTNSQGAGGGPGLRREAVQVLRNAAATADSLSFHGGDGERSICFGTTWWSVLWS